jgi:hypothetical protein
MSAVAPPRGLEALVAELWPGARIDGCDALGPDPGHGAAEKAEGYGRPLRVVVREASGASRALVFRTMAPNEFGHDRRADRVAGLVLAHDGFSLIPDHVQPLDVGALRPGGELASLRGTGEAYLVTTWAEGRPYAEDLRAVAERGEASPRDLARCTRLAEWLVVLHGMVAASYTPRAVRWRRALRDLVGHGEGVFGIVDAYGDDVPSAPPRRLEDLERRCVAWRWRLHGRASRLTRTHGDFHPFNILFDADDRMTLLDASRGCEGDPADDVTALAVNYVFFALDRREAWARGLGPLWRRFWDSYLRESGDAELLQVVAPFLAWRALVVCCPRFYPKLSARGRDALLSLAERALDAPAFDPAWAEELFR